MSGVSAVGRSELREEATIRNYRILAILWTLVVAVPFTAFALVCAALLWKGTEWLSALPPMSWGAVFAEGSARWPELAGMGIGQAVIMILALLGLRQGWLETEKDK